MTAERMARSNSSDTTLSIPQTRRQRRGVRTTRLRHPRSAFSSSTHFARLTPPRPPHPAPNVRDDRDMPLLWDGMAGVVDLSRVRRKQEYLCGRGWTARSVICPSGNSPLHLQSYKGRALIDFARCEVRYAAHFGNDVDTGVGPRSANIGSRGPYKFGACRSREIGQADCLFSDRLWCLQSAPEHRPLK